MMQPSASLIRQSVRIVLLCGVLVPVVGYLYFEFSAARQAVDRDAVIQARIVDQFVGRNPDGWRYAGDRLVDALGSVRSANSVTRVLDADGTELSRIGGEQTLFWVSASRPFHDYGVPAGQLEVGVDMSAIVQKGALLGCAGLLLGLLLLALLKRYVIQPLEKARQSNQEMHSRLRDLLELSADWFWETDAEFRFTVAACGGHFAGFDAEAMVGKFFWQIDCDWTDDEWAALRLTLDRRQPVDVNYPATVDGAVAWFNLQGKALFDGDGRFSGYRGTVRDVSERVRIQEKLTIVATAFEMQECIMVMDSHGRLLRVNDAFLAVTGYMADEVVGHTLAILKSERQTDEVYEQIMLALAERDFWHGEVWNRHKDGRSYLSDLTIKGIVSADGRTKHFVGSFHDITERRETENNIHQLAFFDPLTRLPNRRLLFDRLQMAQAASQRSGQHGALMFIDLDNFKALNDTRGHDVGDLLLCEVASRLLAAVRADDSVVRLGGDEFVVMLENLSREADEAAGEANEIGRKLLACLNDPFVLQGQEVHSTPSVGVVLFCGEAQSIDQILKYADAAMYQSKAAGRNALHFFDPDMQAALEARVTMENDLRSALAQGQFRLHYQAQVDPDGRIVGAEVLLRWTHPVRGMVSPAEFIPLAEDCGLILPLGQWVLEATCTQLKIWAGMPETRHLTLAVNVSARQYHQADFVDQVLTVLDQSGIDPEKLKLELTESLLVKDVEDVIRKMSALKARGVCFALDDFGTGYSSLSYLKRLPLDQLKIDQSFVRDLERDDNDAAICAATIGLAQNLGLSVIAEGVETEAQRHFLCSLHHCDLMQGYLFARPLPLVEFEALLASRRNMPVSLALPVVRPEKTAKRSSGGARARARHGEPGPVGEGAVDLALLAKAGGGAEFLPSRQARRR